MIMNFNPEEFRLVGIFMPRALEKMQVAASQGTRFVHYTSAEAALEILKKKEIWMRKSSCMNDYMEVEHGLQCLYTAYGESEGGKEFKATLDTLGDKISNEVEALFNGWTPQIRTDTYFTCISEHDPAEDTFGRLSMWRAYSEGTGVALVVNNTPFLTVSDALKANTSPVAYLDNKAVGAEFARVAANMRKDMELLKGLPRETIVGYVFSMLRFAALCTKHPGFKEEREWRIVYSPSFAKSDDLIREVRTIRGVPQPIYKIPLRDLPNFKGIEIPALLDRLIIGPTAFPVAMHDAFVEALSDAGIPNAPQKVFISDIPLRR
jgi:hypothetical protein